MVRSGSVQGRQLKTSDGLVSLVSSTSGIKHTNLWGRTKREGRLDVKIRERKRAGELTDPKKMHPPTSVMNTGSDLWYVWTYLDLVPSSVGRPDLVELFVSESFVVGPPSHGLALARGPSGGHPEVSAYSDDDTYRRDSPSGLLPTSTSLRDFCEGDPYSDSRPVRILEPPECPTTHRGHVSNLKSTDH